MQWKLAQTLVHGRIHILCVRLPVCVPGCCESVCVIAFARHLTSPYNVSHCCCHTLTIILVIVVAGLVFCILYFVLPFVIVVHATRMKTWKNWRKALNESGWWVFYFFWGGRLEKITREKNEVKWICSGEVAGKGGGGRWAPKEVT